MKEFFSVFEFEIMNYFKSKIYLGATLAIMVIICVLMFIPRMIDLTKSESNVKDDLLVVCDYTDNVNVSDLEKILNYKKIEKLSSDNEVKKAVETGKAEAGFVINSGTDYTYYVYNSSMSDNNAYCMEQYLSALNKAVYCESLGLNYADFLSNYEVEINGQTNILGKDSISNYAYCYVFVSIIFVVIILYGNMIATSVTTEKGGKIIEVLVTSTNTTALLFGKVLAGTLAVIVQVALIMLSVFIGYEFNHDVFGETINMMFNIPIDTVIMFALFGVIGFIFYSFLYGCLGAMLSKTEDVQNASLPLQILLMIIYIFVIMELRNVDGLLFKISSYLPISSCFSMFARGAMGTVNSYEIVISFAILVVSVILVGYIGAKKYRKDILNYGNKILFFRSKKTTK